MMNGVNYEYNELKENLYDSLFMCYNLNNLKEGEVLKLPNKIYDVLKWLVTIVLPATATLYTALGGIWALPYIDEIPATIVAVDTFLGAILMISTMNYNKDKYGA